MRIITGSARGVKLETLQGEKTRPTRERVKESIFSAIQFDIYGKKVLELFGGCGQMALEAVSRGGSLAVISDNNREAVEIIKKNIHATKLEDKCRAYVSDWKSAVHGVSGKEKFSLVFLDPPYGDISLDEVIDELFKADVLEEDYIIVCESGEDSVPAPSDDKLYKLYTHGKTYVTIIRPDKVLSAEQ